MHELGWNNYGASREGYWNSSKFMKQIEDVSKIAEVKYPAREGYKLVWIFDHNSCHTAMAEDALDATKMNVNPGKKAASDARHHLGRKTSENDFFALGIPKGMHKILE